MLTIDAPGAGDGIRKSLLEAAGIVPKADNPEWIPGSVRYLPIGANPDGGPDARLVRCRLAAEPLPLVDGLPQAWDEPVDPSVPTARTSSWNRTIGRGELPGRGRMLVLEDVTDGRGWNALYGRRIRGEVEGVRDRPTAGPWDPWNPRAERNERVKVGSVLVDAGRVDGRSVWRAWRVLPAGPPALETVIERGKAHAAERLAELLDRDLHTAFGTAVAALQRQGAHARAERLEIAIHEWAEIDTRERTASRRAKRRRNRRKR